MRGSIRRGAVRAGARIAAPPDGALFPGAVRLPPPAPPRGARAGFYHAELWYNRSRQRERGRPMEIIKMTGEHIEECVDLFVDAFTKAPWNDTYNSREQVADFFQNHMANNYFVGYVLKDQAGIIALCAGMKKPWINGMEYYIDQFCVKPELQGKGIGSHFLKLIEREIHAQNMNAIILSTERGFPSENFYLKNGFQLVSGLIALAKS